MSPNYDDGITNLGQFLGNWNVPFATCKEFSIASLSALASLWRNYPILKNWWGNCKSAFATCGKFPVLTHQDDGIIFSL